MSSISPKDPRLDPISYESLRRTRWLAMSIVWDNVEPRGPSPTVSQPCGGRLRREPDHSVCRVPWTAAFPEAGRPRLSADPEGSIPRALGISMAALTL
jgi:hypothetical protein